MRTRVCGKSRSPPFLASRSNESVTEFEFSSLSLTLAEME